MFRSGAAGQESLRIRVPGSKSSNSGMASHRSSLAVDANLGLSSTSSIADRVSSTIDGSVTRARLGISKPNPNYALSVVAASISTPKSAKKVSKISEWKRAMQYEFVALQRNEMWTLVPRSKDDNVINCLWLFKVKQRVDGSVERLKA